MLMKWRMISPRILTSFSLVNAIYSAIVETHACEQSVWWVKSIFSLTTIHLVLWQLQCHGQWMMTSPQQWWQPAPPPAHQCKCAILFSCSFSNVSVPIPHPWPSLSPSFFQQCPPVLTTGVAPVEQQWWWWGSSGGGDPPFLLFLLIDLW